MNKEKNLQIEIPVKIDGIDEEIAKVEKLVELLREAKTLMNELASVELRVNL